MFNCINSVTELNDDIAWKTLIPLIQRDVLSHKAIPLPFISEYRCLRLNCVLFKTHQVIPEKISEKRDKQVPVYHPAGPIHYLIWKCRVEFVTRQWETWPDPSKSTEQVFNGTLTSDDGTKQIEYTIEGYEKWLCYGLFPNDVQINQHRLPCELRDKKLKSIYVISEVFYSSCVTIRYTDGIVSKIRSFEMVPIGFRVTKYKLKDNMFIGRMQKRMKRLKRKAYVKHPSVFDAEHSEEEKREDYEKYENSPNCHKLDCRDSNYLTLLPHSNESEESTRFESLNSERDEALTEAEDSDDNDTDCISSASSRDIELLRPDERDSSDLALKSLSLAKLNFITQ